MYVADRHARSSEESNGSSAAARTTASRPMQERESCSRTRSQPRERRSDLSVSVGGEDSWCRIPSNQPIVHRGSSSRKPPYIAGVRRRVARVVCPYRSAVRRKRAAPNLRRGVRRLADDCVFLAPRESHCMDAFRLGQRRGCPFGSAQRQMGVEDLPPRIASCAVRTRSAPIRLAPPSLSALPQRVDAACRPGHQKRLSGWKCAPLPRGASSCWRLEPRGCPVARRT
jgi:hypothetical protein